MARVPVRGLLVVKRFFPLWFSYFLLAFLFLLVWLDPTPVGWDGATQLRTFMFVEVTVMVIISVVVSGLGEPGGLLAAAFLPALGGIGLFAAGWLGPLAAALLAAHVFSFAAELSTDDRTVEEEQAWAGAGLVVLVAAWALTGLLPLPEFGWNAAETPSDLWWRMPSWDGNQRIPHAMPAMGFLYFGLSGFLSIWREGRTARW